MLKYMCDLHCEMNGGGEFMLSAGSRSRRGNLPKQTNQRGGAWGKRGGQCGGLVSCRWPHPLPSQVAVTSSGDER